MNNFLKKHLKVFIIIFAAWLIFFIGVIFLASDLQFSIPPKMSLENLGIFGDSFNVLTSLFTGLAFAGVIISVILQTQELKEARDEFRGQKEALENQEFDNKFFQMLNLLNNIKEGFSIRTGSSTYTKVEEVMQHLKDKFHDLFRRSYDEDVINGSSNEEKFAYFQKEFIEFNNTYDTTFKYFFINLYQILKYIDTHQKNPITAKEYANILRAQLSKNELILLTYNAIGVQAFTTNKYQLLVEKYSFFEHLKFDDFCERGAIITILTSVLAKYDDAAFGDNHDLIQKISQYRTS